MPRFPGFRRAFNLPWRSRENIRDEVEEELRFHIDMRIDELTRSGLNPDEARRRARKEFGDLEDARASLRHADEAQERRHRRALWWEELGQDVRFGVRLLRRSPGFTLAALSTLALGIGANTAIFSVVDGVLLRPAPFADADRLTMVWETDRNSGTTREPASVPDFVDFRERSTAFSDLGALLPLEVNFLPEGDEPGRLPALAISHRLLPLLGIRPLLGRTFTEAEDQPGGPNLVLVGERFWERRLGRDPGVLGRTLHLNDQPYTIAGVVPAGADFGVLQLLSAADYGRGFAERGDRAEVELWFPLQPRSTALNRSNHPIFMIGRLRDGATVESAQLETAAIAAELEAAYPENQARGVFVEPLEEVVFGPVRPALLVLLGAVALVLLIACANVANLLLARGTSRTREVAIRASLGAGSARLTRQFLVESLVLALAAAALGVGLARLGIGALLALAPPDIARLSEVGIDPRALAFTLTLGLAVGIVFGMVPTLQARRLDLQAALRAGAPGATGGERGRVRSALVVAEVGLAVLLLAGAGLLIKSFWRLLQVDPGFRTEQVLKAEYHLPDSRYPLDFSRWPNLTEIHSFNAALLERVATLPGVSTAAIAGAHPLNAGFTNSFTVVGREAEAEEWPEISIRQVTPDYFRTLEVPLLRGRPLRTADDAAAPAVLLINQAAAERFFAGREPLGQQIAFWGANRTIVGVVGNERFHGLAEEAPPAVYAPFAQVPTSTGSLLVRATGDPAALAGALRAAVHGIDPALAVFGVETLDRTLSRSVGQRRFTMLLLGLFAGVALLLAVIGVHGVLSYAVARRTREIGIRMALGASRRTVVGMVLGEGWKLIALGGIAGLAGAVAAGRVLRGLLYGVSATDPVIFAGVAVLLAAVACLASWLPARRATRVDPVVALRSD